MLHKLLKEATQALHTQTEEKTSSHKIAEGKVAKEDLKLTFLNNYIFHSTLENAFEPFASSTFFKDVEYFRRKKVHLLADGLNKLGFDTLPEEFPPFELQTTEDAIGAFYVKEGSTLGGVYILKSLKKIPHLEPVPEAFYNCYGEETGKMWKSFCEALNKLETDKQKEEAIIQSAKATFVFYSKVVDFVKKNYGSLRTL
jgi:heme oxygenase (biliverdin-IX-beta and delta-forming)